MLLVREAWRLLRATPPALAILDLGLPDGSGLDLCQGLRREPALAALPVVMLTARSDEIDRVLGLELGADDYLAKPFSPRELVARVRALPRRAARAPLPPAAPAAAFELEISNLLANAIDFAPPDSTLDLTLRRRGGDAVFELRDHGPGVADYALAQLGERFFSLPRPRDGRRGSGLGLAIVRQVAVLHGGVVLLIGLVLMRIGDLVDERRWRQLDAVRSVEQSLAGAQTLLGPLLHRACVEEWDTQVGEGKDRRTVVERREFRLASVPQTLHVSGEARAEARYRGLFKVNGYAGTTLLEARWESLAALQARREHAGSRLQCGPALLMLALSDVRGLRSAQVQLDDEPAAVRAGTFHPRFPRGLHAELSEARSARADQPLSVRVTLELLGTARLALVPAAGDTRWSLRSDWPHPPFGGRFLPAEREVGEADFAARWAVSALASAAAAEVLEGGQLCDPPEAGAEEAPAAAPAQTATARCLDIFGVAFIDPVSVDWYALTEGWKRSAGPVSPPA